MLIDPRFIEASEPAYALEVHNLSKSRGSVQALTGFRLAVQPGQIAGICGPRYAGKTTLLDCIAGTRLPDLGSIRLSAHDITRTSPAQRVAMGISRTHERVTADTTRSVRNAVLNELFPQDAVAGRVPRHSRASLEKCHAVLDELGLYDHADQAVSTLGPTQRRWLSMAAAMVTDPAVLLMDEPTAWMTPQDRQTTGQFITALSRRCAVVLTETDLSFVSDLCDQVTVLHRGETVAVATSYRTSLPPIAL